MHACMHACMSPDRQQTLVGVQGFRGALAGPCLQTRQQALKGRPAVGPASVEVCAWLALTPTHGRLWVFVSPPSCLRHDHVHTRGRTSWPLPLPHDWTALLARSDGGCRKGLQESLRLYTKEKKTYQRGGSLTGLCRATCGDGWDGAHPIAQ